MEDFFKIARSILVVVVLYKRSPLNSETLCSMNNSCANINIRLNVLVYDNSPVAHDIREAITTFSFLSITYIHDPANAGVAGAYNYGLQFALNLQLDKLWIFDQDSSLIDNFVEQTFKTVATHPDLDLYLPYVISGAQTVSPTRTLMGRSIGQLNLRLGVNSSKEFFAINSGMLMRTAYLSAIGGYDARFKLYLTDNWFCDTFVNSHRPFALTGAKMLHDLSRDSSKDVNHLLAIYRTNLYGYREIYKNRPIHFIVLGSFAVAGAVKRAVKYRDKRFITALQDILKK